jgi:hypothetical protein
MFDVSRPLDFLLILFSLLGSPLPAFDPLITEDEEEPTPEY